MRIEEFPMRPARSPSKREKRMYRKCPSSLQVGSIMASMSGFWPHEIHRRMAEGKPIYYPDIFSPGLVSASLSVTPDVLLVVKHALKDEFYEQVKKASEDETRRICEAESPVWRSAFSSTKWESRSWSHGWKPLSMAMARGFVATRVIEKSRHDQMFSSVLSCGRVSKMDIVSGEVQKISSKFDHTFWEVSPTMAEAAFNTRPPREWNIGDVPLPLGAMNLVLPRNALKIGGMPITGLFVGDTEDPKDRYLCVATFSGGEMVTFEMLCVDGSGILHLGPVLTDGEGRGKARHVSGLSDEAVESLPDELKEDRKKYLEDISEKSTKVLAAAVNICLIASFRPDLLTDEEIGSKPVSNRRTRRTGVAERVGFRIPRSIGEDFVVKSSAERRDRQGDGSSGRKMPTHWRSGHLHWVWYGKGKGKIKRIWYQPVKIVNPHEEQKS